MASHEWINIFQCEIFFEILNPFRRHTGLTLDQNCLDDFFLFEILTASDVKREMMIDTF